MLFQKILYFFIRPKPSTTSTNNACSNTEVTNFNEVVSEEELKKTAAELDIEFFSWLLQCPEQELIQCDDLLKQKKVKIHSLLDQHLLNVDQLPRRPTSLPSLIKVINDEGSTHKDILLVLLTDPALTAKIIKTANSPYFQTSVNEIENVEQALFVLGREGLRNVVSTTIMQPMLKGTDSKEAEFSHRVWQWALLAASASDMYRKKEENDSTPLYLLSLLFALSYLSIFRFLLKCQKEYADLKTIEPSIVKSVIEDRCWSLCLGIVQKWSLPTTCEKYLNVNEISDVKPEFSELKDGIVLAKFKVLQRFSDSPIDERKIHHLTSAPDAQDSVISRHLNSLELS